MDESTQKPIYLDEHKLRSWFANAEDVHVFTHMFGSPSAAVQGIFIYCNGMTDIAIINDVILPELDKVFEQTSFKRREDVQRSANLQWNAHDSNSQLIDRKKLASFVFEGFMIFCLPSLQMLWTVDIANLPSREPNESTSEVSIRGPKDGFVEHISVNIALIRKRLRTDTLACQYFTIGSRTLTKTALLYIEDIADTETIKLVRHKLSSIDVEKLISTGQLEELLSPSPIMLFPLTDYTGRPDFAVDCLMNGRFIILVDGNPTCIIAPINLFLLMKSPEDAYFPHCPLTLDASCVLPDC